jgi:hypothetical protein
VGCHHVGERYRKQGREDPFRQDNEMLVGIRQKRLKPDAAAKHPTKVALEAASQHQEES